MIHLMALKTDGGKTCVVQHRTNYVSVIVYILLPFSSGNRCTVPEITKEDETDFGRVTTGSAIFLKVALSLTLIDVNLE